MCQEKLIGLGAKQFAVVAVTLLLALPVCVFLAVGGDAPIYAWYQEKVVGVGVRTTFGFETGALNEGARSQSSWGVTRVVPRGVFDKAGVRAGDVPRRIAFAGSDGRLHFSLLWYHGRSGAIATFYSSLAEGRGRHPVTFTVCAVQSMVQGEPCPEREVTVVRGGD